MKEVKRENSLAVTHPELAKEWHPTKNGDLTPYNVATHSNKKVWWICDKNHEWQAVISNRVKGSKCPYCSGRYAIVGENDFATVHPELVKEWHPTKNGNLKPSDISYGSGKKVWWQCEHGHEWQASISHRTKTKNPTGCPYCSGRYVAVGVTDLATTHPEIAKQWHPTKNGDLTPNDIVAHSNKKVWWQCEHGHEWQAMISNRTATKNPTGCPYCSGRYVAVGVTDLATTHPKIAKQWHPTKNGNLKPTDVVTGSGKKVWWQCEHGHEWEATIVERTKGNNCPYCSNHRILKGFNDLMTTHPEIAKQWHPTKNGNLKPTDVLAGSGKKVWWQCEHGHEWETKIAHRTRTKKPTGCPYCSGKHTIIGITDLATTHPELVKEWHPTKNGNLKPTDVSAGSNKKVWWICDNNHEWKAAIYSRVYGNGCPHCAEKKPIIRQTDLNTTSPELAKQWHPTKNGNLKPTDVSAGSGKKVWWQCEHGHEWEATVSSRVCGNGCPYCAGQKVIKGQNDLATIRPDLVQQWHPTKNGNLKPTDIVAGSRKKIWWQCEHGHEWQAKVCNRTKKNSSCPYCSNHKVLKGFNDLATTHPEIAKQWHPTKNGNLVPTDVLAGSSKKIWWQCEHGHEWQAFVYSRTSKNSTSCPYCSGRFPIVGKTDLSTTHPHLTKEWHPTKNNNLKPTDVVAGSKDKVWWQCEHGHEWKAAIYSRSNGVNCPYCSNHKVLKGFNDLATTHPEIAKQWHPTKNSNLKPTDVVSGSGKKVWWQCEHGHEWEASISHRTTTKKPTNCPYCSGRYVIVGKNDFATVHPELVKEWHPTKNGNLKPSDISYGSGKKVWWQCEQGHEWQTAVSARSSGCGCPICSLHGTSIIELTILHYIKKFANCEVVHRDRSHGFEIDVFIPSKNIGIEYDGFYSHKDKKQYDLNKNKKCKKDGIKLYRIREEGLKSLKSTSVDFYCKYRDKNQLSKIISVIIFDIFNINVNIDVERDIDLQNIVVKHNFEQSVFSKSSKLRREWHPTKNAGLDPKKISIESNMKVWWQCEHGHEWEATICSRTRGNNCPYCSNRKILRGYNDLATTHPEVARQWHPTKNGDLKPTDVSYGSQKKVWWIDEKGRETYSVVYYKTHSFKNQHKVV